jgi:ABC-2 type transport system ATP-binding protein
MGAAIEVTDLVKTFKGGIRALTGVSFAVEQGTVFGLLGPNGAGKTTAVRVLTTVLRPDSGTATVLGRDVLHDPDGVRSIIGLAGQYAAVDENLTGRENLQMIAKLNHLSTAYAKSRAVDLLRQFDLTDAGDRVLKTYSGGMRRRLDLAAALVSRPQVLFLDEPTTGLDPQSRLGLWQVIEDLVNEGTTVLLTTQYLEEADRLASQLAVIDHGAVISEGSPAQLKARLGATVVHVAFADAPTADKAASVVAAIGNGAPRADGNALEINVEQGPRTAMEALRLLDQAGIEPTEFALREPSLDDVFLALTGRKTEAGADDTGAAEPKQRRGRRRPKEAS